MKKIVIYANARPVSIGLFTVLLTVVFGMSVAWATGFITPSQVFAQVVGPPCCDIPAPPPPVVVPVVPPVEVPVVPPPVVVPVVPPIPPVPPAPIPIPPPLIPAPVPTCVLTATANTLSWTTVAATSASVDQGIGAVSPIASGSKSISVTSTITYTMTVSGPGGQTTCDATVTITPPPPPPPPAGIVCTLSATNPSIVSGGSTALNWTTSNATSFSIDNSVGSVTPVSAGSKLVSPTTTTTYTGTATGPAGSVQCTTTVTVTTGGGSPAPACVLSAAPTTVNSGDTSVLSWTTTNAVSFSIDQGIGSTTPVTSGSTTTAPISAAITFTGTATSASGAVVTCTASVNIATGGGGGCSSNCSPPPTPTGGGGGGGGGSPSPTVTLAALPHIGSQPLAFLYLSQIPYTGLDLGPLGTALYWTALIGWSLALAYLILFGAFPVLNRNVRNFGVQVATIVNSRADSPIRAPAPVVQSTQEVPRSYSTYDGFKSFANNGALSIEDIVKSLSRTSSAAPAPRTEPVYENVEPIYDQVESIMPMPPVADSIMQTTPAHVRGFTTALLEGDREAVFAGLRQHVRGGGAPEQLITSVVCLLDDVYRSRVDGATCDADIARITARLTTPTLEKLIAALTTAIDSSYSTGVTGAKLALTRALATLGA